MRKRNKTALVGAIALALSGAAYSAHANFAVKANQGDKERVASDVFPTGSRHGYPTDEAAWNWTWSGWHPPTSTTSTSSSPTTSTPTRTTSTTTAPTSTSSTTSSGPTSAPTSSSSAGARWPGQVPGKFYLGMSCGTDCADAERSLGQSYGVHRQFKSWGNWSGVAKAIQSDHAADRLPWISIKGPSGGSPSGWQALANGSYDSAIKSLATALKANDSEPVLITFHHEPSNDGSESQGRYWAAAYSRFHDVLKAEGALANVADPPILGDWLFNPRNPQDPANWLTAAVMQRMPFLGIDMYENTSGDTFGDRIPSIINWMAQQGYPNKMIGIGETGATDGYRSETGMTAVQWLNESLSWVAANTDKVAVVSYFNSMANSRGGVYWPLDESWAKMTAYRSWLGNSRTLS